ncbi:MAG: Holliday junction branch migration DNA helicase RuvB [Phycisphaeraceae bacterium]|nr:Holliday junction branch migration DNA helicase RuvB [Phycisphaeraceae bacterium]
MPVATHRIIAADASTPQDEQLNLALRPQSLAEYVGQPALTEKLDITLQASRQRGEAMEHVLLHGPPGLGKTTLAHIISNEMGTHLTVTAGPALTKPGDLVGILTKLQPRDVLFIDEIHRLPIALEEYLYSAMEDYKIDVQIDSGMHAKTITLPVQPFTLIGATTRAGLISSPMRSRFGLSHNLEFYSEADLLSILMRSAGLLDMPTDQPEALSTVASRSRGTPRIANRLLRRVRDFSQVKHNNTLNATVVDQALKLEGVDALGLDELDRKYLRCIAEVYEGGPVGLEAVAATLGDDAGTLEQAVEPYLLQIGFLARTRKGRQLTKAGAEHLGLKIKVQDDAEPLFE